MKQIYVNGFFKGYNYLMKYISNIAHMSDKDREVIQQRIRIIEFFDEFGLDATKKAFSKGRSTIFVWKKKLKEQEYRL